MARYIVKRLVGMVIVVFLVLTIAFIIVRLAPGDPAALMLGPDATPEDAAALRSELGLDRPIIVAYLMITVFMFVVINLIVDVTYSLIDPRVRLSEVD